VHLVVDALGLPLVFEITDSDAFRAALDCQSCLPVIPSNRSRAGKLPYDKQLYNSRSGVECTFNLLKQARHFATRYEKALRNYAAVVALGCALLWLRV
jgi:transposase